MRFLEEVRLIQGSMGIYVSNWRLARAVSMERPGVTAGTVSSVGLDIVYVRLLQLGDPGGHVRRALDAFDQKFGVDIGRRIRDRYFIDGGKDPSVRFKGAPSQIPRSPGGLTTFHVPAGNSTPEPLELDTTMVELLVATAFAEVWLAKEGHSGNIFINFLQKIELPLIYALYGAMLAGVDGVVVGAGNPDGLAATCSHLANHDPIDHSLPVLYRETGEEFTLSFDPRQIAEGRCARAPLKRPAFLAIMSLQDGVKALTASTSEPPDGFIIEHHTAGGHNAGPVGPIQKDPLGQPIYGENDEPDIDAIRELEVPFWLAGGYDSRARLEEARAMGATGIQVGSVFALAEESGMRPDYRTAILNEIRSGAEDTSLVRTTLFSPTGFPFKVVQLRDTLADPQVFESRQRVCDLGLLVQLGLSKPSEDGSRRLFRRCPAGPVESYMNNRGLERNTDGRRCLCNALLSGVGLGQSLEQGEHIEEPAIVTLGNHLGGIRRLSRRGQAHYWVKDVVVDILGSR